MSIIGLSKLKRSGKIFPNLKALVLCLGMGLTSVGFSSMTQAAAAAEVSATTKVPMSVDALEVLVSGVAFYPDSVVEKILQAAGHPLALHQAANKGEASGPLAKRMKQNWPDEVEALTKYPEILVELDSHLLLTTRLGLAYKNQPSDVWKAIDNVRNQVEKEVVIVNGAPVSYESASSVIVERLLVKPAVTELVAAVAADEGETVVVAPVVVTPVVVTPVTTTVPVATPVVTTTQTTAIVGNKTVQSTGTTTTATNAAGTVTAGTGSGSTTYTGPNGGQVTTTSQGGAVVYSNGNTTAVAGAGQTTVSGPNGNSATATGAGAAGKTTVGDTTYAGAAGAGTVTTSNGGSYSGAGAAKGQVTQTGDTATWSSDAAGAVKNNNTGATAAATHSGEGSATKNVDGSTSFDRSATNTADFALSRLHPTKYSSVIAEINPCAMLCKKQAFRSSSLSNLSDSS